MKTQIQGEKSDLMDVPPKTNTQDEPSTKDDASTDGTKDPSAMADGPSTEVINKVKPEAKRKAKAKGKSKSKAKAKSKNSKKTASGKKKAKKETKKEAADDEKKEPDDEAPAGDEQHNEGDDEIKKRPSAKKTKNRTKKTRKNKRKWMETEWYGETGTAGLDETWNEEEGWKLQPEEEEALAGRGEFRAFRARIF